MKTLSYIAVFILFISVACNKKQEQLLIDYGYNYYYMVPNKSYVYLVDSISYNDNTNTIDTFKYQLKYSIDTSNVVAPNTYRIMRFARLNDTALWQEKESYFIINNNSNIELIEDGIHYIKLIFPVADGKKWNANVTNNFYPQWYQYKNIAKPYFVNDSLYSNTITVFFTDNNAIEELEKTSVYAKNVGLICYKNTYINTQNEKQFGYKITMYLKTIY